MVSKKVTIGKMNQMINSRLAPKGRVKKRQPRRRRVAGPSENSMRVSVPAAEGAIVRLNARNPRMNTLGQSTFVTHTESFFSPATLAAGATSVNNSTMMPTNYPWLSGIAPSFSKWRWISLRFIYIPTCPTSTAGKLVLGTSFDFGDTSATTATQVQQTYHSTTSPVWAGFEGSSLLGQHNIRPTTGAVYLDVDVNRFDEKFYKIMTFTPWNLLPGAEKAIYSPGQLIILTTGGNAFTIGDLFVQYCVELIEPFAEALNA